MRKWNYKTHRYDEYTPPIEDGRYPLLVDDMAEIINCAQCGKEIVYGDGYVSMEIHTQAGFGYVVCEECYQKEWSRRSYYEGLREGMPDHELVFIAAVQYALSSQRYVSTVTRFLSERAFKHELSKECIVLMIRDIKSQAAEGYGYKRDKHSWLALLAILEGEYKALEVED